MDYLGDELLAYAALSGDQHRKVCLGHLQGNADGAVQCGRIPDDAKPLLYGFIIHTCEFTIFSPHVFDNYYICLKSERKTKTISIIYL